MKKYKLVAMDVDGTLLNEKLEISPRTMEAIRKAKEQGIQVTLSTGRMYQSSLPFAQKMGLAIPLINYNGALIKHSVTGETYYHEPVPLPYAQEIIKMVDRMGLQVNVYLNDNLYVEKINERVEIYTNIAKVKAHAVGSLREFLQSSPTKMLVIGQAEQLAVLAEEIRRTLGNAVGITKSKAFFLEIISPKVNKGQALKVLAEKLGIKREEVVAFGDNYNDVSMIEYAGLGVAMSNGPLEVQAKADLVALSNEEEGVADVIEKYVL